MQHVPAEQGLKHGFWHKDTHFNDGLTFKCPSGKANTEFQTFRTGALESVHPIHIVCFSRTHEGQYLCCLPDLPVSPLL